MKRAAHELPPYVVTAADAAPTGTEVGGGWLACTMADLLAEPKPRTPAWLATVYGRLLVASSGPVLVADVGPCTTRLERARWMRVAPDADLVSAARATWPTLDRCRALALGCGSLAPQLVIVGEQDPHRRAPMFAKSGVWLFRALRGLGYDELSVYVCNALDDAGHSNAVKLASLAETFAPYEPTWLALGTAATEVLTAAKVEHVRGHHPAWHRRYKFNDGPEGYGRVLTADGLPPGEWAGHAVPRYLDADGTALAEHLEIPLSTAYRREASALPEANRHGLRAEALAAARLAFVTGVLPAAPGEPAVKTPPTAKALAAALGIHVVALQRAIREGDWETERAKHLETIHERSKASAAEVEAKRVSQARDLSWAIAVTMGGALLKDLKDGTAKRGSRDFKAVVDAALMLSEKGDVRQDDERKRLGGLSPQALLAEYQASMEALGVTPTTPPTVAPKSTQPDEETTT